MDRIAGLFMGVIWDGLVEADFVLGQLGQSLIAHLGRKK
jgi:hypothetical protein